MSPALPPHLSHLSEWTTARYLSAAMTPMAMEDMKTGTAWTATTHWHSHFTSGPNGHFW